MNTKRFEKNQLSLNHLLTIALPILFQQARRLRYSINQILTTSVASAITISLFLYIFGDFLRERLPKSNSDAAENLRFYLVFILIFAASLAVRSWSLEIFFKQNGWIHYLQTIIGERIAFSHNVYACLLLTLLFGHAASFYIIDYFIGPLNGLHKIFTLLLATIHFFWPYGKTRDVNQEENKSLPSKIIEQLAKDPLVVWRRARTKTNQSNANQLKLAAVLMLAVAIGAVILKRPLELSLMACLFGGITLSWNVPLLVEEDLRFTWLERQAAISHKQWIKAWQLIFTKWSFKVFIVVFLANFFAQIISGGFDTSMHIQPWGEHFTNCFMAGMLAAFPLWLAPSFVLQVDGRKILTNIVMITLVDIFVGTAIMAVPYLTPGIWLLGREAHRYQEGRFARASNG